jgi:hypothetical protein
MTSGVFPPDLVTAAQQARSKWGCPASVCLAQWALESAWGASMSGTNNPFGIKARAGEPFTAKMTWEVINGQRENMPQNFRNYSSIAEAFDEHGKLLATGSAYTAARAVKNDANAYANALTGHYATDPAYGSKLISIMKAHDLYQHDTAPPPSATVIAPPHIAPKAAGTPKTKAKVAAVIVAAGAAASAPLATHGGWLMAGLVVVAIVAIGVAIAIHFRK